MNASKGAQKKLPRIPAKKIPAALIYEIMDGKPIYYKGYREVLRQEKTLEEVMGSSNLQATILECILTILFQRLDLKNYRLLTNEVGIHLQKNSNLSGDILIYDKKVLPVKSTDKNYISVAPKIQIEVDIQADLDDLLSDTNYIRQKTDKLFEFGVEKVIWVLSESKSVIVATPNTNWEFIDWHKDIDVIDGISFCIGRYLREEGSPFA
jgi:Uma2 family endonuclease